MKFIFVNLILAAAAMAQAGGEAPTTDQVLDKYVQALGGRTALEKLTTRMMKGKVENTDDNSTDSIEIYAKAPDKFILMTGAEGAGRTYECLNGTSGWLLDPDSGMHQLSNQELALAKMEYDFHRDLKLKELYPKMTVAGRSKVAERPAIIISAAPASGPTERLYFDVESGLLVKREYERVTFDDGIVPYEIYFDDYKDFDGVKVPVNIRKATPDSTIIYTISEVKFNAPVEDGRFSPPKQ